MSFNHSISTHITLRACVVGVLVAALTGSAYPYIILKIGYGPNISLVSAFFGFIALSIASRVSAHKHTPFETNLVQTAGTAASQSGFMCAVLAAFDILHQKPELGFNLSLTTWQIFMWLSLTGMLGVILAVPLRRHYIDEENLPFADGMAAGETIMVLEQGVKEAKPRVTALSIGFIASGLLTFLRDGPLKYLPNAIAFGAHGGALKMGAEVSLLSLGSGLIIGLRVALSMALGMVLAWVIAPPVLVQQGIVSAQSFAVVLKWIMWPALGFLVAGGLMALFLKWRLVVSTFRQLAHTHLETGDVSLKQVAWLASFLAVSVIILQAYWFHIPVWLTVVGLLLSCVMMLVGTRVLGETNWAPISALANLMQVVFFFLSPGNMMVNMVGSGMSGSVASNGEHLMQDYRAGKIVGSINRDLTFIQLLMVPIGALAVALVYPALRARYGIGEHGLTSPISMRWASFAELLNVGFSALPPFSLAALLIALVLGAVLATIESRYHRYVPSPTALGLGMLIPGESVLPMVIGGIIQHFWIKYNSTSEETYGVPLSSGMIAGEALVVLILSIWAIISSAT